MLKYHLLNLNTMKMLCHKLSNRWRFEKVKNNFLGKFLRYDTIFDTYSHRNI